MTIVYDGSFEGFLTLVYKVYYEKIGVSEILKEKPVSLFEDFLEIETDEDNSNKVLDALKTKFTKQNLETILNSFMCDSDDFEVNLLHYIVLGFKNQNELQNINNFCVFYLRNLQKELFHQVHKMTGFTRFEELDDGTLYAKIDTKYNLLYFLGKHFLKRFNNQKYIIHDIKRELAFIKNEYCVGVQNIASFEEPILSDSEEKFKKLWSQFFKSISIKSRENYKLQRNVVPLWYRTYMNEFD